MHLIEIPCSLFTLIPGGGGDYENKHAPPFPSYLTEKDGMKKKLRYFLGIGISLECIQRRVSESDLDPGVLVGSGFRNEVGSACVVFNYRECLFILNRITFHKYGF